MYNTDFDKKERQKIVAIATATAALILVLVVAIIVVAVQRPSENLSGQENNSFVLEEEVAEEPETKDEETASETAGSELGSLSTKTETVVEPTNDKMPVEIAATGPADMLPIALMMGTLTTVATAGYLKKAKK